MEPMVFFLLNKYIYYLCTNILDHAPWSAFYFIIIVLGLIMLPEEACGNTLASAFFVARITSLYHWAWGS